MASFIHPALFLVLFSPLSPILFGTHSHVQADDSLIKLQCRNSETPALCIQCIKSDPGAPQADKVGIAAIVINCLRTHSRILASNMTKMASREDDERLRSAYQSCSKDIYKVRQIISVLMRSKR
ncbi:hypothetical protein OIU77_002494 [Salix suchowensis]|uniref:PECTINESTERASE INHIBITOR-LIKE n=2 Tax=Salix TaxID=40685 RepID=A0A9Q0ZGB7_9ROSI|nr:hypothetical protein OIU77_002494 [Salix suchowensis]KAJ6733348.1 PECTINESTERASE INHIBITOR-LIKE [Salix koriyanagi]